MTIYARHHPAIAIRRAVLKISARFLAAMRRSWLRWRERLGMGAPQTFERSRYGVDLHANWSDRTFQYCHYGIYGNELANLLSSQDQTFLFLDIGANQGLFSLIAAKNPSCAGVVAFEPVARTFGLLQANIEANHLADRIRAVPSAISNTAGRCAIAVSQGHSGAASLRQGVAHDGTGTESISLLTCVEFDPLIPEGHSIFAKIDVEGHEPIVIAELLRSSHHDRIGKIFYEIDERWVDPHAIRAMLETHGFRRFTKLGTGRHYDMLAER
jgi:FkbM family methyltransferase